MYRQLIDVYPTSAPTKIGLGDRLLHESSETEYLLARIPGTMGKVFLASIRSGGHWSTPIHVENMGSLTREEVKNLIGSSVFNEWKVKVRGEDE